MAYDYNSLSVVAPAANGFTLWSYKTADDVTDVLQTGYFDQDAVLLRAGDVLYLSASIGETPAVAQLAITRSQDGVVDVALMTLPMQYRPPEGK